MRMAQKSRTIPCLDKLRFQKELERGDLFFDVKGFERLVVEFPILLMNNDWRMIVPQQEIIHDQSTDTAVAVCERMDVLKPRMKVGCGRENIFIRANRFLMNLIKQICKLCLHIFRCTADLISPRDIIMLLESARPFTNLPSARIVRILRQFVMKLQDELRRQGRFSGKGVQNKIAGIFGIAYLKDRSNISRKIRDAIAIKDLARIMVRDIGIFHLPRMISKLNDIAIERRLKLGDIPDLQILPRQENFIVFVHTHASCAHFLPP